MTATLIRLAMIVPFVALAAPAQAAPPAAAGSVKLVAHRAIYDLTLGQSRGRRLEGMRGRILYDFSGSACDGYALQFRQVSELDNGEGKIAISDLRSATWEDAKAKNYRFNSQNYLNQALVETVDGKAQRESSGIDVNLSKPKDETVKFEGGVFPTEHMRRIIEAAHEGKTLLELPVYDGSDTGEKIFNTLTVIGHPLAPDEKKPNDAAADNPVLAGLKRWPVTISYFDKSKKGGEQEPLYAISFELYENGVSRALSLDYNDFVVKGEMTSLDIKDDKDNKDGKGCP